MSRSCRGICTRHKAPTVKNSLRYDSGQKRCSFCGIFFITSKDRCICCNTQLRYKSRSRKRN